MVVTASAIQRALARSPASPPRSSRIASAPSVGRKVTIDQQGRAAHSAPPWKVNHVATAKHADQHRRARSGKCSRTASAPRRASTSSTRAEMPSGPKPSMIKPRRPPSTACAPMPHRGAHEDEVVQLVEVPFVVEEFVEHPLLRGHLRRQLGVQDVIVIGEHRSPGASGRWARARPRSGIPRRSAATLLPSDGAKRAVPERGRLLADEIRIEHQTGEQRAGGQDAERRQHRSAALVDLFQLRRVMVGVVMRPSAWGSLMGMCAMDDRIERDPCPR